MRKVFDCKSSRISILEVEALCYHFNRIQDKWESTFTEMHPHGTLAMERGNVVMADEIRELLDY
jgi:hypothetical protein